MLAVVGGGVYAALGGVGAPQASTDVELQRGLVGWWKLDGNAKDNTPYGNNGTTSNATPTADRKGLASAAYSMSGTASYVQVSNSSSVNIAGDISVSAWVYRTSSNGVVIHKDSQYSLYISGGQLTWADSSNWSYGNFGNYGSVPVSTWTHLAVTKQGSTVTIYMNGSVVISKTFGSPITTTSNQLCLAAFNCASSYLGGYIDDVRLYKRALSANEVGALYQQYDTSARTSSGSSGLVGWWKLNGNTKDSSPYGNNATLANSPSYTTDRKGATSAALGFDGNTQYATAVDANQLDSGSVTVSLWFTLTTDPECDANNNYRSLIRKGSTGASTTGWNVVLEQNKFLFWDIGFGGVTHRLGATNVGMAVGTPIYLTFTYDAATGVQTMYANGVQKSTVTLSATAITANTNPIDIARGTTAGTCPNGSGYTPGVYNDVRVYNRALSIGEITNIYGTYNSQINLQSSPTNSTTSNINSGLVGYWPFNGNAKDTTPYSNNGTVSGATLTTDRKGRTNSAYQTGNTGAYINVGSPATYANLTTSGFTYSVWVMRTGTSSTQWPLIMGASNTHVNYAIRCNAFCASVYFEWGNSPYDGSTFSGSTAQAVSTSVWHMFTVTYSGTTLKTYFDGSLVSTTSGVALNPAFGGMSFTTSTSGFAGYIDDARVYKRALSATEITQLFNSYY